MDDPSHFDILENEDSCAWADFLISPSKRPHEEVEEKDLHEFPSKFIYQGYSYSIKDVQKPKCNLHYGKYRCKKYRGQPNCKATLHLFSDQTMKVNNIHECNQSGTLLEVKEVAIFNAEEEMKQLIESRCMTDATKPAAVVAREVWDEVHQNHAGYSLYI
jgi:hypothetical protein